MAKHIEVNLLFQANTQAAISNLQSLGRELNHIATTTTIGVDDGPLQQASQAAQQLQVHLQNAVNVDTGKLDLVKLNNSLKVAKTDLKTLTSNLQSVGPAGQQAFIKVATAIASAEAPMMRVNKRLQEFGQTLLNTAKWQIASTAIHGVSGMLSEAVRHAEELNVALNDIRIVTGASTFEMAHFAETAAEAANALNTTSTEYAKAALIFYQQGLSGDDVLDRANTVVKLAQVTGQSATKVSDQMTAIWNNFDDGSESLEYYADVLAKLGADTAASTDEISEGLEKFAAVGKTIGLEYETAAAAVATVVDKTRQSADIVGTSFKTIFARMQSVSLGETLDDGVNLTKYSEALEKVGVSVLDTDGQLRAMDDILNDLGEKWQGLGATTQTAIAQTVGGIRQYNQMMALMNNWTDVQDNIEKAKNAGGELEKQASIWSESYTAAAERVKQAKNELYESFLNDGAVVKLTDTFATLINNVKKFIDSIGGVGPMVLMLVGLFSKMLFPMIRNGFNSLVNNIAVLTGSAQKNLNAMQASMREAMEEQMQDAGLNESVKEQIRLSRDLLDAKQKLAQASKNMSAIEQEEANMRMATYEAITAEAQKGLERKAVIEQEIDALMRMADSKDNKTALGTAAAVHDFTTQRKSGVPTDEADAEAYNDETELIVADATSMSRSDVGKELKSLEAQGEAIQRNAERQAEMERLTAKLAEEMAACEAALDSGDEAAFNAMLEATERTKTALQEQQDAMEEVSALDEERLQHLTAVAELQKQIATNTSASADGASLVVGTSTTGAFADAAAGTGSVANEMATAMQTGDSGVLTQLGATMAPDTGNVDMSVSIEGFKKVLEASTKYKTELSKLSSISKEFEKAQKKVKDATEAETKASKKVTEAQEELNDLKAAGIKDTKKYEAAVKKLRKAQQEHTKALGKLKKAEDEIVDISDGMSTAVKEVGTSLGWSDDVIAQFDASVAHLQTTEGGAHSKTEAIALAFKDVATAAGNTGLGLDAMSQDMMEVLIQSGANKEQIEALAAEFEELGIITPDVANKLRALATEADKLNNHEPTLGDKFQAVGTKIGSTLGQITAAIGAVQMMAGAFEEGNTPLETFTQLLSGAAIMLPIIIGATTALATAEGVLNAAQAIGIKLKATRAALDTAEGVRKVMLTVKTWLLTAAEVALKIAQNPVLGAVILGLIVASTVAVIALSSAKQKEADATQKQNEANKEAAESANEVAGEWAKQVETMDELAAAYRQLTKDSEGYNEAVQKILDATPDLVKSYQDYAALLGADSELGQQLLNIADQISAAANSGASDAVDTILKLQDQADSIISEEAYNKARMGAEAAMNTTAQAIVDVGDAKWKDGKVTRHVGGSGRWGKRKFTSDDGSTALNEEEKSVEILMQSFGNGNETNKDRVNGYDVAIRTGTTEDFIKDYKALQEAADRMNRELGDQAQYSDTYREVMDMLEGSKDQFAELEKMQKEVEKYGVFKAKSTIESKTFGSSGEKMDISNISSMKEYQEYKEALLAEVGEDPVARATAEQWLEAQGALADYVKVEDKLTHLENTKGKSIADQVRDIYDNLSDDEKELFLEVDLNTFTSQEGIKAEIARMQAVADKEEIEVKLKAISTAKDALKEDGMTEADFATIRDSGIDWGETGFQDFLNMSYEEQVEELERMEEAEKAAALAATELAVAQLNAALNGGNLTSAEAAALEEQLIALEQELAIKQKMAQIDAENKRRKAIEELGLEVEEVDKLTESLMANSNMSREAATATASAYLLLADSLDLTTDQVQEYLDALGDMGLSGEAGIEALKELGAAAEEYGVDVGELIELSNDLANDFSLTGTTAMSLATQFAEAASLYDIPMGELEVQVKALSKAYGVSATEATRLAVQNQRMNKGIAALNENWVDWKKELKASDKTTTDYAKAAAGLTDTIKDLVGATGDLELPDDFFESEENLQLIEEAANGSTDAINRLGLITAQAALDTLDAVANTHTVIDELGNTSSWALTAEQFLNTKNVISEGIESLQSQLNSLEPGDGIKGMGDDWIQAMNDMALATNMSVEEMNSMLNQMGVSANVTTVEVEQQMQVPKYETIEQVEDITEGDGPTTYKKTSSTKQIGTETVTGTIPVASISTDDNPDTPDVKFIGNGSASKSSTSSGGGSTTKPKGVDKKKDSKERYMQIDAKMDDVAKASADANREMETLYGSGRIAKMSQINKLLEDEVDLLEQKTLEAQNYLLTDKQNMLDAFGDAGAGTLTFDASGNVSNIESVLDNLDSEYNSMVDTYNGMIESFWSDGVISASEQEQLDNYKELMDEKADVIDEAKSAYDAYAGTLNTIEETEAAIAEKVNQIKTNNYQKMVDNLNLALESTTAETQEIDYYLNKIADDFYKMAEAAALTGQKMDVATEVLALQKQHADGLAAAYAKGNITQADYVAGLKESRDAIYGELESLQSLDSEMQDYYGNTLSMAQEELGKHTERMDHLNSVLDHYQSLLSAIGKETDFKSMGVVLQGIADGAENSLAVAKAEYAFYKDQADQKKALMDSVPEDSAAFEVYKKEWKAAEAAARESQDNMLSATTEWAESMKAVIENELSDFAKTLEQQLTGGTSFDEMTTSIERAASLQEDYLTTTNKIYETTKMMRVAEKALDETTSTAAKNKLKGFIETTKQLQGQEKLSQFELDMQQKKYDLLLAEIALEETQNAKSTVRLQRDAEGNFGYVYTADSNQVADAEQKVADAENALYNKGLEGANDYAQKYQSTMSEMYDTMTELQNAYLSGEITSQEEYDRRMLETKDYYYQQLTNYSELYNVALGANTAIAQEAWSTEFASMTGSTEQWMAKVDEYTNNCGTSFQKWQGVVSEVQGVVGGNFDELATKVTAITNESNALVEAITKDGGVIDKLGDEVTAVSDTTKAYAEKRDTILEVIAAYEAYLATLNGKISQNSGTATVGDTTDNIPSVTPSGFDTGGYTGQWGPTGKLAVLHQKEIVLNAEDTENLLQTVGMVRTILQTIDMHSMSAQIGGILSTPGFHGGESGSLEQNVKIEASFPNVQDRNEIEEAFNNLINRASQYANH